MIFKRRYALGALFLVLSAAIRAGGPQAEDEKRPNVVLLVADNLGYGDLGFTGAPDIQTPRIDRLAREGIQLRNFYSSAPLCTPSRAALIAGRYQQRFGLETNLSRGHRDLGLPASEFSVATALKNSGYTTGFFGKWHLGFRPEHHPNARGFDEFFGILDWSVDYYSHRNLRGDPALFENDKRVERTGYLTELITERAERFIRQDRNGPLFAMVAYNAVVAPIQPPGRPKDVRSPETWFAGSRNDYARMVESLDSSVGRILDALEGTRLRRDTLVIYTHDHGGEWLARNEPFFHGFGTLWEGGIRVPCILRWPRRLHAGEISDQLSIMMDLTATVLAAANTLPSKELDGIDLLPILVGESPQVERTLFWRLDHSGRQQKAVRQGRWKYMIDIWNEMLFDLEADPSERRNVGRLHPDIRQDLRRKLDEWEAGIR